LVQFTSAAAIE